MDKPFKFLRPAEWETLKTSAKPLRFASGQTLLAAGARPTGIMVIEHGQVAVRRDAAGFDLIVAEVGPGAVLGEMSFVEALPAEVSLVAVDEVRLLFVDHSTVQAIIRDNPAFAGRFFQSIAHILSRRLRETTSQIDKEADEAWLDAD